MNQEIAKIDDMQFGELIHMPKIFEKNQTMVLNARSYTEGILSTINGIDLTKVDAVEMETKMQSVRDCRGFLAEAREEINAERMPHTRKMDTVVSLFVGLEKELKGLEDMAKASENAWETEKLSRQRAAQKLIQDEANKAEEKIKIRTIVTTDLNNLYTRGIMEELLGMNKAFNSKFPDELSHYGEALAGWTPEIPDSLFLVALNNIISGITLHNPNEIAEIRLEVIAELRPALSSQWTSRVNEDKNRLIDTIPSRIEELKEAAANAAVSAGMIQRQAQEEAAIVTSVAEQGQSMQEVAQSNAQAETMTAVAGIASQATPVVPISSGTKVKQKYKVNSHQAIVALLQSYIKYDMVNLTIDEINTKFSFVRTACDKRLNQANPEVIQSAGLEVIEDVQTRRKTVNA